MIYVKKTNYNKWLLFRKALQPWTFPASALSFLLGTALAWKHDKTFYPSISLLTALVLVFMHAAGNFVNSFYEAQSRRFFATPATRRQVLQQITRWTIWSYFLALASFGCLSLLTEARFIQELGLLALGFLGSLLHGTGLKNIVLGDVVSCGIFGPLSVLFTYTEQVGTTDRELPNIDILLFSVPFALYTEAIFHSQNTRDLAADRRAGHKTLAVLVGPRYACALQSLFLVFPYVFLFQLTPTSSIFFLLALSTLPFALAVSVLCFSEEERASLPKQTSLLYTAFGIFYVLNLCA